MASGKLPPRQKMIGLMYLVLLALLAMNVSKDILESFVIINDGIETTASSFEMSNEIMYSKLKRAAGENKAYESYNSKAQKIKKEAQNLYDHIDNIKNKMYQIIDQLTDEALDTIELTDINSKDNFDEPSRLMGIAEPSTPREAKDCPECSSVLLKQKLNDYHKLLLTTFKDKDVVQGLTQKLSYLETGKMTNHEGKEEDWEVGMFYHNPLAAVITTLSKIQSDIRISEAEVVAKLYEKIDGDGVSFNTIEGMAILPKAYVLDGDSFSAKIFTAAYDNSSNPEIYISRTEFDTSAANAVNSSGTFDIKKIMKGTEGKKWGEGDWYKMSDKEVSDGKGNLKIKEGVGVHNWGGLIKLTTKKGPKIYPFSSSFEVGKPSLAVSADAMNVFYIGIDNPVSISAPMPKFTASAPGLSKSGNGWVMRPKKPGKVSIVVSGIDETTGNKVNLGKAEFRVKRIPKPISYFGGKSGSVALKRVQLKNTSTVQAKMDGFEFDIKVNVSSFEFSTSKGGVVDDTKCRGNKLNPKAKAMLAKAKRNQKFFIEKIMAKMPDGSTVQLAPIIIKAI